MFTPQKLWAVTPRGDRDQKNGSISGQGSRLKPNSKGPTNGDMALVERDGSMDQGSLTDRVGRLENELFEYQYNMGLLLIEKKEWSLKYDELRQALVETSEAIKREEAAHLGVISELENREENLKKALGVERQCVHDLENALRKMRSEHAEIKFGADSKLAEANLLVISVEEKSLEVEAKFHAADAKLAEIDRKSSEIERKMHELESQENALRRERTSFNTERKTQDTVISKEKNDLREWEHKLKEAEQRLADGRKILNQREEIANDNDRIFKEKQNDLEEIRKKIEMGNLDLKNKEEDMRNRLAILAFKEKNADDTRKSLEAKERQLLELEETLTTRESIEIQKLLDEHEIILAEKKQEFELEMEQKRKLHDEQLKNKVIEVEEREAEIAHMEDKVKKREQTIEKKSEKLKEKELEYDLKSKALKEREKFLKAEEKSLDDDKMQLHADTEELLCLKAELENLKAETEKQQLVLIEEREQLKVTEDERLEFARLQSELKHEIEKCRFQSEELVKEADDLKKERLKFEKEWEDLDERGSETKKEQDAVLEQKKYLEKLRQTEEEKLLKEKLETQEYVQRELEALQLAQDSFAATMEHEKSIFAEKCQSEKSQLLHDFELRKQELETEIQRRQEEIESQLQERVKSFAEEKEMELNNVNYLREVARREMEEMKLERQRNEKEKLEISENKKHVESQQFEMKKDIEELVGLSQKLKDQREQFIKERERFIAFAEKQKNCNFCGEIIREFMLSDLHSLAEVNNLEAPPLPSIAEDYMKQVIKGTSENFNDESSSPFVFNSGSPSGGTISWLRKCTSKIFKLSPGKKLELDSALDQTEAPAQFGNQSNVNIRETIPSGENELELSEKIVSDSFDVRILESNNGVREAEAVQAQSVDQGSQGIPENSQNSNLGIRQSGRKRVGRPKTARTTRSVKSVITAAKTIVGQSSGDGQNQYANGNVENSVHTNEDSRADSTLPGVPKNSRKRNLIHASQAMLSDNQSEGHSDSVKDSDRPKRRQRVAATELGFGHKRYNLRRHKGPIGSVADGSLPESRKSKEKDTVQEANPSENVEIGEHGAPVERGFGGDGEDPARSIGAASAFSPDSPNMFENSGGIHSAENNSVEVNGTEEVDDGEFGSESRGEENDDDDSDSDDGDEDEMVHPGEVSIGKKLWTFLTT